MGVASGMPAKASWLPLLVNELPPDTHWQVIAIGRKEVWPLLRKCAELGGHVRTGLEDTFYLPDGKRAKTNEELIATLVKTVKERWGGSRAPWRRREQCWAWMKILNLKVYLFPKCDKNWWYRGIYAKSQYIFD